VLPEKFEADLSLSQATFLFDTPHSLKKGQIMNPMSRVVVKTNAKHNSRLHIYNHGEDDRVVNEGDLLIVSSGGDVDFEITIKGRDMFIMLEHVQKAMGLWDANKDYLSKPATRIREDRIGSMLDALQTYKAS